MLRNGYAYNASTTRISGNTIVFTKDSGYQFIPGNLPEPLLLQWSDALRNLPPDVSGKVSIGATASLRNEGSPDWRFAVKAQGDVGDLSYKVDVEARRKDNDYYFIINNFPSILGTITSYKGQWFKVTPQTATTTGRSFDSFSSLSSNIKSYEANYKVQREKVAQAIGDIVTLADKHKLLTITKPVRREKVGNRNLYRYDLSIKKEAMIPFYEDLMTKDSITKNLSIVNDPGVLQYLKSAEFDTVFNYYNANTWLTMWTDSAGYPARIEYRLRVVPPDTATQLRGKQVNVTFVLEIADINKGKSVDVPPNARPFEDVMKEVSNNVRGVAKDAKIEAEFSSLRTAADMYYDSAKPMSYGNQVWHVGAASACVGGMFKDADTQRLFADIDVTNGDGKVFCQASGERYIAGADLVESGWFCVDSEGVAKKETGTLPTALPKGGACP